MNQWMWEHLQVLSVVVLGFIFALGGIIALAGWIIGMLFCPEIDTRREIDERWEHEEVDP